MKNSLVYYKIAEWETMNVCEGVSVKDSVWVIENECVWGRKRQWMCVRVCETVNVFEWVWDSECMRECEGQCEGLWGSERDWMCLSEYETEYVRQCERQCVWVNVRDSKYIWVSELRDSECVKEWVWEWICEGLRDWICVKEWVWETMCEWGSVRDWICVREWVWKTVHVWGSVRYNECVREGMWERCIRRGEAVREFQFGLLLVSCYVTLNKHISMKGKHKTGLV